MNHILAAVGAAALIALTASFIRGTEARTGAVISAAATVLLLFLTANQSLAIKDALSGISDGQIGGYMPYILKCVCIGFFTQTAYDVCFDSGERGIASKVLTAGKLGILTVCLPLIKQILDTALGYIK